MMIFLFCLILVFLAKPIEAQGFSYQFVLTNNSINLDFLEELELDLDERELKNFLFFEYKLEKQGELPLDLPLFLVAIDKEVLFSADASLADGLFHKVELDLSNRIGQMPVFYQSSYLDGFELSLKNLIFTEQSSLSKNSALRLKDLSVIRELNQSLSVIFSLEEVEKTQHSFQLVCLDEQNKSINSVGLVRNDDFLWSNFSFINLFANQKNELIFHLDQFECGGFVRVVADFAIQSDKTSIIRVEDL